MHMQIDRQMDRQMERQTYFIQIELSSIIKILAEKVKKFGLIVGKIGKRICMRLLIIA